MTAGRGRFDRFELRRKSDGLVYSFELDVDAQGRPGYRRSDRDLRIIRSSEWGWISTDPETGAVTGRSWDVHPRQQGDHPPPGLWVTCKGIKSYVYDLVYP